MVNSIIRKINFFGKPASFFSICLFFFLESVVTFLLVFFAYYFSISLLGVFFLFQCFFGLAAFYSFRTKAKAYASIFAIFLIISHVGQTILSLFGNTAEFIGYNQYSYTNFYNYYDSIRFIAGFNYLFFVGLLIPLFFKKRQNIFPFHTSEISPEIENKMLFISSLVLAAIGVIPYFYIFISKFKLFLNGSYLNTYTFETYGFVITLANFFIDGCIGVVFSLKNKRKIGILVAILTAAIEAAFMITGNRGDATMRIIVLLAIVGDGYFSNNRIQKIGYACFLAIGAYLGLTFLQVIASTRNSSDFSLSLFFKVFWNYLFSAKAVLDTLGEYGITIYSVFSSLESFPSIRNFTFGVNYFDSFLVIFPNFNGGITRMMENNTFLYYFVHSFGRGGSIIGESYFAFGFFGVFIGLLVGIFFGDITKRMDVSLRKNKSFSFFVFIIFMAPVFWWVRNYFYGGLREVVWGLCYYYIIYRIFRLVWHRKIVFRRLCQL